MIKRLSFVPLLAIVAIFGFVGLRLNVRSDPGAFAATQSATAKVTGSAATARSTFTPSLTFTASPAISRTPTLTLTPSPLASFTPSKTLLPPPTFEPPTNTPLPSAIPTATITFTPIGLAQVPGLVGAETNTPISTPGCIVRKDWKLTYTVQFNDALINIAKLYNISTTQLMQGNCLSDANKIYKGQILHAPGAAQPTSSVQCFPIQVLTPINNTVTLAGSGQLTFHWYGPRVPRDLIRVFAPDGTKTEYMVELRQDYSIDLSTLPKAGLYQWYVYPLDNNFVQNCPEGGPWNFTKAPAPTPAPTLAVIVKTPGS